MIGLIRSCTAIMFCSTKRLQIGEVGMHTSANPEYTERSAIMTLLGISHDAWKRYSAGGSWYYEVLQAGYKYNMTDIAAAIGLHQLARSDWLLERRRENAQRDTQGFSRWSELETPPNPEHVDQAWHLHM